MAQETLSTSAKQVVAKPTPRIEVLRAFLNRNKAQIIPGLQSTPDKGDFTFNVGSIQGLEGGCTDDDVENLQIMVVQHAKKVFGKTVTVTITRKVVAEATAESIEEAAAAEFSQQDPKNPMSQTATASADVTDRHSPLKAMDTPPQGIPLVSEPQPAPKTKVQPPRKYPDAQKGAVGILDEYQKGKRTPKL